jgi:hypothetical protein
VLDFAVAKINISSEREVTRSSKKDQQNKQNNRMEILPKDLLLIIFEELSCFELGKLELVNKFFFQLLKNPQVRNFNSGSPFEYWKLSFVHQFPNHSFFPGRCFMFT